jgi:hypothetical protein
VYILPRAYDFEDLYFFHKVLNDTRVSRHAVKAELSSSVNNYGSNLE